jgi:LysM repeat protein
MNKRSPAPARIGAVVALAVAAIVVVVAVGGALGGGDSGSSEQGQGTGETHRAAEKRHVPATYEVQSGDTLISIARRTGVSVGEIEALNPEVDPQILIAGETLKLR